jgi:membrane protein DedA with SNARE-associated domain
MVVAHVLSPIPSELIIPLAGFLRTQGRLSWVGVVIAIKKILHSPGASRHP